MLKEYKNSGCGAHAGEDMNTVCCRTVFALKPEKGNSFALLLVNAVFAVVFGVLTFDSDYGYGNTDCGKNGDECSVGRCLSAHLALVMTE